MVRLPVPHCPCLRFGFTFAVRASSGDKGLSWQRTATGFRTGASAGGAAAGCSGWPTAALSARTAVLPNGTASVFAACAATVSDARAAWTTAAVAWPRILSFGTDGMAARDLVPVMQRVAALADRADVSARGLRRGPSSHHCDCRAILEELTGQKPDADWRPSRSPDAASVSCLAKSVRLLASMLAATQGAAIPVAGVLAGLGEDGDALPATAVAARWRECLTCRAPFKSEHDGHRLCDGCRSASATVSEGRVPHRRRA